MVVLKSALRTVLHSPGRKEILFFVCFQCLQESLIEFQPWGLLFSSVGIGEKQVGSARLHGSVEEDKALGPSEVVCTLAI